jgi:GT2 family glycosyltransferase
VAFNDIDLCLKIGNRGYRVPWTPFAELVHLGSASRGRAGAEAAQHVLIRTLSAFNLADSLTSQADLAEKRFAAILSRYVVMNSARRVWRRPV